ncbi:o-succinylbenzoate synthase [Glaesserella parasuis]|uniref:o-succinylbenzoate synthase n=2 Tax=Glaesserella parasuis TaxID=738 RepID=B8QR05_GLAPU|nr:o-succinylbenzoate synthase [Glaesserella parasuis]ACG50727.1 MenC [Glaesserella parasuis str. Nagasaki]ATW45576.1 o-succinylbenzoate synthase [Glaesserella parasuis str. Nagasaki]EQA03946.1 o-succinylbenzoate synthase [Glaesserella parasuis str. Nagasaki]EYE71903.1 O-succinylbenzoate synthase [Glaesserella parasuis str. Nagasaki]KDD79732.1 O-succinylbenzoate synthase [Glaesserella parasuis ST4-1]
MKTAQLYRYSLPVETGIILRNRRLKQRDGLIIHLQHADKEGWGEIAPLPEFSQETLAEAEIAVRQWIEKWLNHQDDSLTSYPPSVAFGVSCALAELNETLSEEANFQTVPLCYGDPDELYAELNQMQGEKIAKIKVGLYEANRDGLIADMFLEAIPDLKLRLDANRSWTLEKALLFASKIAPERKKRIQFLEEPCKTPELSRQFAEQTGINIAWDETVREPDFLVKKEPNLTAIVIKPTLVGSLEKCISLIEQAHQQGLIAVISSSIESSLGLTQLARFATQYTPNTLAGLDTLDLMKVQLLREWNNSTLPIVHLNSPYILGLDDNVK